MTQTSCHSLPNNATFSWKPFSKRYCFVPWLKTSGGKAETAFLVLTRYPTKFYSILPLPFPTSAHTVCRQRKWFTVENAIASIEHRKPVNCKFLRAAAADVCLSHERTADPAHPPQGGPGCSNTGSQGNDLQRHASC